MIFISIGLVLLFIGQHKYCSLIRIKGPFFKIYKDDKFPYYLPHVCN